MSTIDSIELEALAEGLGISMRMVYKLKKRGMPIDSLKKAIEWRDENLDSTQTKKWRIDGNKGVKRERNEVLDARDIDEEARVLTEVMPVLWFNQMGWLAAALREQGVSITAEQVIKVQHLLFLIYTEVVADYLQEDCDIEFEATPVLLAVPDSKICPSLVERLNRILSKEAIA